MKKLQLVVMGLKIAQNCAKLRMRNRLNSVQTSANRGSHKPILVQPTMCLVSFEKLIQIQEE